MAIRVTQPGGQLWNQAMQVTSPVVRFPNPLATGRHSWHLGNLTTSPDAQILNQFATNQKMHIQKKYVQKTLPEAQRTQGIEFIT